MNQKLEELKSRSGELQKSANRLRLSTSIRLGMLAISVSNTVEAFVGGKGSEKMMFVALDAFWLGTAAYANATGNARSREAIELSGVIATEELRTADHYDIPLSPEQIVSEIDLP